MEKKFAPLGILVKYTPLFMLAWSCRGGEIGVLYALEADWKALTVKAEGSPKFVQVGNRSISTVQIGPHRVRGIRMGSGSVETAVSTTVLLTSGRCDWMISLGPCGSLVTGLEPEDIVILKQFSAWQASPGTQPIKLSIPDSLTDQLLKDPTKPDYFNYNSGSGTHSFVAVSCASGERFVTESADRSMAASVGQVVEMNVMGAVASMNSFGVPGLHLMIISDFANANAGEDFKSFQKNYDGRLGNIALEIIHKAKPDPTSPLSYPGLRDLIKPRSSPPSLSEPSK